MSFEVQLVRLDNLLEITSSKRIHMADYVKNGVPFYRSKEVIERAKGNKISTELFITKEQYESIKKKFGCPQDGDILLTSVGTLGVPYLVSGEGDFYFKDGNLTWLRNFSDKINPRFLYYWLISHSTQQKLDGISIGSTQKALTISGLKSLEIHLPDRIIQDEIVIVLEAVSNRIALLSETNTTLEAIAQAIFKSWFVDFDPVRAKQEGREPEGMDADTAEFFPDSFEESELGLIPKGWQTGILGDISDTVRKQIQSTELNSNLYYLGLEHMPRQSLSLTEWGNAQGLESAKAAFIEGDILFGKLRPYFHKVVVAPFDGVCSTDILVCRPKKLAYYGLMAMHLFSVRLVEYANRLSNGAKMPRVNWKDIAAYTIPIPPITISDEYSKIVRPLFARMTANVHKAQTFTQLRDTLLPRLISGQLRLPDAESMVEEATA